MGFIIPGASFIAITKALEIFDEKNNAGEIEEGQENSPSNDGGK